MACMKYTEIWPFFYSEPLATCVPTRRMLFAACSSLIGRRYKVLRATREVITPQTYKVSGIEMYRKYFTGFIANDIPIYNKYCRSVKAFNSEFDLSGFRRQQTQIKKNSSTKATKKALSKKKGRFFGVCLLCAAETNRIKGKTFFSLKNYFDEQRTTVTTHKETLPDLVE